MSITIRGKVYYLINEAAAMVGVHRRTLYRWFREGKIPDVARDRRGWRIFADEDVERLQCFAEQVREADEDERGR